MKSALIPVAVTLLLILFGCSKVSISNETSSNGIASSTNEFFPTQPVDSLGFSSSNEFSSTATVESHNIATLIPSDITSVVVDDFYSIYSLAKDRLLIHAGNSKEDRAYIISYDLNSHSDVFILELQEAILYLDIIDETSYCVSTYSTVYIIDRDKIIREEALTPPRDYNYRFNAQTNLLSYVDEESNLILEGMGTSQESKIIFPPILSKNNSEPNQIVGRGANPYFFDRKTKIGFVKIGSDDFSPLYVYHVEEHALHEYAANIFVFSYAMQAYQDSLVITSHEDESQSIYILRDNEIAKQNLECVYDLTYSTPYDLLIRGKDTALYQVDLKDYSVTQVFSPTEDQVLSSATSTQHYITVLLVNDTSASSILILPKKTE